MGRQSTTMRICIFLLASLLSPSLSAPTETDRLPQFLQALPFFSELQDLQQTFQDLQANIPAEVMAQITQNLPPLLANLLVAGQQQPAGRGLQDVVQLLKQTLPPSLANLLATQLTNGGSSQLLQQLQTVLPPEVFQQLQQTLQQPAAGRAGSTGTVLLSNTNGGFVFTGRSALDRGDDKYDDIETMRRNHPMETTRNHPMETTRNHPMETTRSLHTETTRILTPMPIRTTILTTPPFTPTTILE